VVSKRNVGVEDGSVSLDKLEGRVDRLGILDRQGDVQYHSGHVFAIIVAENMAVKLTEELGDISLFL